MTDSFSRKHLDEMGFAAPTQLGLAASRAWIPSRSGVYVVLLDPPEADFLSRSVGGHFKRLDPTVTTGVLEAKWVPDTPTMYIGRANDLHTRIGLLRRYGESEPVAHRGGRYLWQLAKHESLQVTWRPDSDPVAAEAKLLDEFEAVFGTLPFANLVRGARPMVAV